MHDLVEDIYLCALGESEWNSLLPQIGSALGCSAVAYGVADIANGRTHQGNNFRMDDVWLADYEENWDAENPWRKKAFEFIFFLSRLKTTRPFHAARHVPQEQLRTTDVYHESLKKMDLTDCISLPMRIGSPLSFGVNLYCGHAKEVFTDQDRALAGRLSPHLTKAADAAEKLSWARRLFSNNEVSNALKPAVLISGDMDLIEFNELAENAVFRTGVMKQSTAKAAFADPAMQKNSAPS